MNEILKKQRKIARFPFVGCAYVMITAAFLFNKRNKVIEIFKVVFFSTLIIVPFLLLLNYLFSFIENKWVSLIIYLFVTITIFIFYPYALIKYEKKVFYIELQNEEATNGNSMD